MKKWLTGYFTGTQSWLVTDKTYISQDLLLIQVLGSGLLRTSRISVAPFAANWTILMANVTTDFLFNTVCKTALAKDLYQQ